MLRHKINEKATMVLQYIYRERERGRLGCILQLVVFQSLGLLVLGEGIGSLKMCRLANDTNSTYEILKLQRI